MIIRVLAGLLAAGLVLLAAWLWMPVRESGSDLNLRVGIYQNEPKIFRHDDGRPDGFFVRLLEQIADREGWNLDWVDCQWQQCLEMLQAGQLDLMPDVAASPDRRQRLDFHAVPVVQAWSQIYRRPDTTVNDLADLAGQRVAVLGGSVQEQWLQDRSAARGLALDLMTFESLAEVLAAVGAGHAEAAVSNHFYGRYHAAAQGLIETPVTFDQVSLHFVAASGQQGPVLAVIDDYLLDWKVELDSPYYQALNATIARSQRVVEPVWVWPVLVFGALAVLLLVGLAWALRSRIRVHGRQLATTSRQLTHLLDSSPVVLYTLRPTDYCAEWVSGNIERLFHYTPAQALEPGWFLRHVHPDDQATVALDERRLRESGHSLLEYRFRDARGQWRYLRDEKRLVGSDQGGLVIGSWTDLTESYRQQRQVRYLAQHDVRTGLPNRSLLTDRLRQAIQGSPSAGLLVVFLDLDRFRSINEHHGLSVGDQLLQATGRELSGWLGDQGTVARVGSDEFCLFVPDQVDPSTRARWLDGLLAALGRVNLGDRPEVSVSASLGVAFYPEHGRDHEALLAAAELASQAARTSGGNRWQLYDVGMGERSSERLALEQDLRHAIDAAELRVHYQPQFALQQRRLSGLEALVRWQHPQRGLLGPGEFIGLAEDIGLIGRIDLWVLTEACRQLRDWDDEGLHAPRVAVNLSARQFYNNDLVEFVERELKAHGLAGERLELEITETMLMEFPERALKVMAGLEALGVRLSMDDFGSGYSNLAFLRRLPLHQLKIDQSLIQDLEHSHHSRSIVRAIIALANALELELVAEGIEDAYQLDFLGREGCSIGQGYLLGRPGPVEQITQAIRASSAA